MNNERIGLLESIGFEWRIRISLPVQPLLSAKAISVHGAVGDPATNEGAILCIEDSSVDLSSIFHETKPMEHEGNGHEYKWNLKYDQLKRYNDLLGTTHVPSTVKNKNHAVYSSQLAFLAKWVETQRKLFQKRKKGQKSGLSKSRINMVSFV